MPASKEYFQEYYLTRKRKLLVIVGGEEYTCAQCFYREDDLEFDHIHPKDKSFTIGTRIMQSWRPEKYDELLAELQKCQLLCPAHHAEKTRADLSGERGWRHGTWYSWMKKLCKCQECSDARDSYNAGRRANRGAQPGGYIRGGPYVSRDTPAEHGTCRRYRRGCRCDPCKLANTEKAREQRQLKNSI